jgi:hypothetical protein
VSVSVSVSVGAPKMVRKVFSQFAKLLLCHGFIRPFRSFARNLKSWISLNLTFQSGFICDQINKMHREEWRTQKSEKKRQKSKNFSTLVHDQGVARMWDSGIFDSNVEKWRFDFGNRWRSERSETNMSDQWRRATPWWLVVLVLLCFPLLPSCHFLPMGAEFHEWTSTFSKERHVCHQLS